MRFLFLLPVLLLWLTTAGSAQVVIDLHALDALPPAPPRRAAKPPAPQAAARPKPATSAPHAPTVAAASTAATAEATPKPPSAPATPTPELPSTPPPVAALTPVAPPPAGAAPPPPPPPPVSSNATTTTAATKTGLRVDFAPGQSELSPSSAAAIKDLAQRTPPSGMVSYDVAGHAAGTPEDPSTARRLSLARALAVRSALISDGVPSTRIFVRALGSQEAGSAPDRVEVTVQGENASAVPQAGSH